MKPKAATVCEPKPTLAAPVRGRRMLDRVFTKLCSYANTPYSMAAYSRYKEGEIKDMLTHAPDPFFYTWNGRYNEFELDYQVHSLLKKFQDFDLGINREEVAYGKWLAAEASCAKVNSNFRSRWMGKTQFTHQVEEVYYLARQKLSEIVGTVRPRDLDVLRRECRHGPGSDLSLGKHHASSYEKFRTRGAITASCSLLYDEIFGSTEDGDVRQDYAHEAQIVESSRLSFVPKTALVDRGICVGPRWNVFLQLGIGTLLQHRLLRFGQDITSQARNQRLACRADELQLATVDLSSASDTISTNLVLDMFAECDPMWLELFLKSRERSTTYRGATIRLEKISSMGNGYTFPLETVIFYAFACAAATFTGCSLEHVSTYGDDIILPRAAYSVLVETLGSFGFSVNTDKSYASGDFFESCGMDYFRGKEVRPVFLKNTITNLEQAMVFHNQLVEWSSRGLPEGDYDTHRLELADIVVQEIPRYLRRFGPVEIGGVLHGAPSLWRTRPLKERTWEGLEVLSYSRKLGSIKRFSMRGHLYSKLTSDLNCGNSVIDRGTVKFRDVWIHVTHCKPFVRRGG